MTGSRGRLARLLALVAAPCLVLAAFLPAMSGREGRTSLLLLAGLAGLAATAPRWSGWLLQRRRGAVRSAAIDQIERCSLGQGNTIHLVEVAGQRLLLSSSSNGVTLLARLGEGGGQPPDGPEAQQS